MARNLIPGRDSRVSQSCGAFCRAVLAAAAYFRAGPVASTDVSMGVQTGNTPIEAWS